MNHAELEQNAVSEVLDLTVDESAILRWGGASFPCALGKGGISGAKIEGDGATPLGYFPLRRIPYRPDRLPPSRSALPVAPLSPRDGWCKDAAHPLYNQQVRQSVQASCELLWRTDSLYDVIVVLGHNDSPVVAGAGSAMFLHIVATDFKPTNGSVALRREDLLAILGGLDPCARLCVQQPG